MPNHSTRGSNEEWIEYRDHMNHGLMFQLEMFEKFVVYWMQRFEGDRNNLFLISYEDLIGERGAEVTAYIVDFLMKDNHNLSIDRKKIECVWRTVVKFKEMQPRTQQQLRALEAPQTRANPHSLREGPRERPYKKRQLEELLRVLQRLIEGFSNDEDFVRIISGYIDSVSDTVPIEQ